MDPMIRKYFPLVRGLEEDSLFITTAAADLEGDVVVPEGMELGGYMSNPLILYLHDGYGKTDTNGLPIGTTKALEVIPGRGIKVHGIDWMQAPRPPIMDWIESAWKQRKLRGASIGFVSLESRPNMETGGRIHTRTKLLEWSIVPLPMNPQTVNASVEDRAMLVKALGLDTSPVIVRDDSPAFIAVADPTRAVNGALRPDGSRMIIIPDPGLARIPTEPLSLSDTPSVAVAERVIDAAIEDPLRWNPSLSKAFDVSRERYEAATAEYALVARYLDCEIKELDQIGTFVPSQRMGSFLSAMDEQLAAWRVEDVRNLIWNGKEAPPVHELIELNSTMSRDFLIHGCRFMAQPQAGHKIAVKVEPDWGGLQVTGYAHREHAHLIIDFINQTWRRAAELNFLKGEAFSLSGKFLKRGISETWADLFLDDKTLKPLQRAVSLINTRGAGIDNRGIMAMGPPGTGKTLSGRIMMREAKSTFIWVSARDFYRAGAFGGLAYAFSLARECAPSILFIEDVDNWLSDTAIDLIKTEMDGIGKSTGVVTILTTNYPERMPAALIDRPGRFHDVLSFGLPDAAVRRRMLAQWLPDLSTDDAERAITATEGYSGAHLRELARFVGILREEESLDVAAALDKALAKLQEQRELIAAVQTADSRYRPTRAIQDAVDTSAARWEKESVMSPLVASAAVTRPLLITDGGLVLKEGRVLSRANIDKLEAALAAIEAATTTIGDVLTSAKPKREEPAPETESATDEQSALAAALVDAFREVTISLA